MGKTKIDWCDYTINPVIGCTYGCKYCYAKKLNDRFHFIEDFSKPQFRSNQLEKINKIKNSNIFMNSMSDIADWNEKIKADVTIAITNNYSNNYLFLTKRINSLGYIKPASNIWIGISITNQNQVRDIESLVSLYQYNKKFISIEPILEDLIIPINDLFAIDWIIVGAETGNRKGKVIPKKEWVVNIVNQCKRFEIPIFMKNSLKKIMGDDFIQEYPEEMNK